MTSDSALRDPYIEKLLYASEQAGFELTEKETLVCHLLIERLKGPASFWSNFIQSLPKRYDTYENWEDDEIASLQFDHLVTAAQKRKKTVQMHYAIVERACSECAATMQSGHMGCTIQERERKNGGNTHSEHLDTRAPQEVNALASHNMHTDDVLNNGSKLARDNSLEHQVKKEHTHTTTNTHTHRHTDTRDIDASKHTHTSSVLSLEGSGDTCAPAHRKIPNKNTHTTGLQASWEDFVWAWGSVSTRSCTYKAQSRRFDYDSRTFSARKKTVISTHSGGRYPANVSPPRQSTSGDVHDSDPASQSFLHKDGQKNISRCSGQKTPQNEHIDNKKDSNSDIEMGSTLVKDPTQTDGSGPTGLISKSDADSDSYNVLQLFSTPRHLDEDAKSGCLVPILDLLNHSPCDEVAVCELNEASSCYIVRSGVDYSAGDEVLIHYGDWGNDKLLEYYGFVLCDNQSDACWLEVCVCVCMYVHT
jgi:hypothetical protein